MSVDTQGFVSGGVGGNMHPITVGVAKNRLVLATETNLRGDQQGKILFHPLVEKAIAPASEVIEKMRACINTRINYTFGVVGQSLLSLAASPDLHHKLTPEQLDLVVMLKDVDEGVVKTFINVMLAGVNTNEPDKLFMYTYIRRGGLWHNTKYNRLGVTTFTMYNELKKDVKEINGVKLRPRDRNVMLALFNFIFPGIDVAEQYNYGSNDNTAPWLDTLMQSTSIVASRLNDVIIDFNEYIETADTLMFNVEWVEDFKDLSQLITDIRHIPHQDKPTTVINPVHIATTQPPQYQQHQPVNISAPPAPYAQAVVNPYLQPAHQATGAPVVKNTDGTIDFQATLRANPNMVMANASSPFVNMMSAPPQYQQQQQQRGYLGGINSRQQPPAFNPYQQPQQQQQFYGQPNNRL